MREMYQSSLIELDGYELALTCGACPEQYDVRKDGEVVGYMRLRHGCFYTALTPGSDPLYEAEPEGDGIFEPHEREMYLREGLAALTKALNPQTSP
jgi:hypothetical protein